MNCKECGKEFHCCTNCDNSASPWVEDGYCCPFCYYEWSQRAFGDADDELNYVTQKLNQSDQDNERLRREMAAFQSVVTNDVDKYSNEAQRLIVHLNNRNRALSRKLHGMVKHCKQQAAHFAGEIAHYEIAIAETMANSVQSNETTCNNCSSRFVSRYNHCPICGDKLE